jgi:hypothetical protein
MKDQVPAAEPSTEVTEFYRDYTPQVDATAVTRLLLCYVPPGYLRGLRRIVLTNASGLSHDRKRMKTWSRQRKTRVAEALGAYYQAWENDPAWIQIFVDNILSQMPPFAWRVSLLRDFYFASTLYHEIGHHIHKVIRPEFREREDVADHWSRTLTRKLVVRRYWYLLPILYPLAFLARAITRFRKGRVKRATPR